MFDRGIDRTIDDVAREMTAGEPASDLRDRVLARIDHFDDRPHARPMIVAVAALMVIVAGAAAVIILRTRITDTTTIETTTSTPAPPTTTTAAGSEKPMPLDVQAPVTRPHRRPRAIDTTPSDVAALAPPPLDVKSIVLGGLDPPPSIEIEQLEPIAPIAATPLAAGDRP
jgi:hypothetical protein